MDTPDSKPQKPLFLTPQAKNAEYAEYVPPDPNAKADFTQADEAEGLAIQEYIQVEAEAQAKQPKQPGQLSETTQKLISRKVLKPRHREVARLWALGKMSQIEIAEKTGYAAITVGLLLRNPLVQEEVDRYRNSLFQQDVHERMKELGPDAIDAIEAVLRDPSIDPLKKTGDARWLIEKLTGKARQEVNVESNTLQAFMDEMRKMQQRGETIDTIDVTPGAAPTERNAGESEAKPQLAEAPKTNRFDKWVDSELT